MIIHCSLLLCLVDPIQYTCIKSCFIQSWSLLSNEDLDLKQVQPREKPDWLSDVEVRFESVRAFIWVWYPFRFVSGDLQKESTGYNDDILYMIQSLWSFIWYQLQIYLIHASSHLFPSLRGLSDSCVVRCHCEARILGDLCGLSKDQWPNSLILGKFNLPIHIYIWWFHMIPCFIVHCNCIYTHRIHGTGIFTYMKTIKINHSCR